MLQRISRFILFRLAGWRVYVTVPQRKKCILCVAPHTSNWDFILGELYCWSYGQKIGFLMKKEWFFWPLGGLFRRLGGIPVFRSKKLSLTDQLAERAKSSTSFNLAVTPEGTRSRVETWKRGFYFIALKAQIPIQLFGIDARHKKIICTKEIFPSGDVEADMKRIMEYYKQFEGLAFNPKKFAIEEL